MKKVLVLVDVQNDFITGALGSKEAQTCIDPICDMIHGFTDGVIFTTQDTHSADYIRTREGVQLPVEHCIKPSFGWQINPTVAAELAKKLEQDKSVSHISVEKPTFGSESLIDLIEDYAVEDELQIVFAGFCTDICVLSNAILAKSRFYDKADIIVDSNCCAGVTTAKHEAALEVMRSCQIIVR